MFRFFENLWNRVIVLDVGGDVVVLSIGMIDAEASPTGIRSVLDSMTWTGAAMPVTPGYYFTFAFDPPLVLKVGEGWENVYDLPDSHYISRDGDSWLSFHNVREVYDPKKPGAEAVSKVPEGGAEGMIEWFQDHPDLERGKSEPVKVGGVAGEAFDVTVSPELPNYPTDCGEVPCVPLFRNSDDQSFYLWEGNRSRVMVLHVNGEALTITIVSPGDKFEGFLAEARKVLESVEWLKGYASEEEHSTEEFKPSFAFSVDEVWQEYKQIPDYFEITRKEAEDISYLNFTKVRGVYDPADPGSGKILPAPTGIEGMVAWLRGHRYLDVGDPEPITVGDVPGMRLDVSVRSVPESYPPKCLLPCVPLFPDSDGDPVWQYASFRGQFIVMDIGGKMVMIMVESPEGEFNDFLPRAEEVLKTVEWKE